MTTYTTSFSSYLSDLFYNPKRLRNNSNNSVADPETSERGTKKHEIQAAVFGSQSL